MTNYQPDAERVPCPAGCGALLKATAKNVRTHLRQAKPHKSIPVSKIEPLVREAIGGSK